jgi:DNA-binding GntR family transcriptional regulator
LLQNANTIIKSMKEQVYSYLFDQLGQSAQDPGTFLDLNQIAAKLGISRTPLRDALIQLEVEGYVEIVPRRGVRVKKLGLSEIEEIYQVIGSLEATALRAAAARFTTEDHQQLLEMTRQYREQIELNNFDTCLALNYKFHDFFLDQCENALLANLVRSQKRRLYDWPRHAILLLDWERKNLEEHEKIVSLIQDGDLQGASDWLKDMHWGFAENRRFIVPFYKDQF